MKRSRAHGASKRILWFAAAWLLCNSGTAFGGRGQKNVLLFYDARSDMLGNIVVDRAIRSVLNEQFSTDIDVRSEYFDVMPLPKQDYRLLSSWFHRKFSGMTFDVVVPVGTSALHFVREYHQEVFNGAQIVYWGNRAALDNWGSGPPLTGVVLPKMDRLIAAAFAFIHKLQPDLKRLIVVSGASPIDRNWESAARGELHQFEDRIAVTYLAGMALEDVETHLENLPAKTAILSLSMSEDGAGRHLMQANVLNELVQKAAAPVYGLSAIHLVTGIVGGTVVNQETMALEVGRMVVRLLRGESIREMPVQEVSPAPMVNWKGLRRWGITEDKLPPGTSIMYKEESVWYQYRWHILGIISLCVLEGVLIIALSVHRTRRRRAEKAMKESKRLLQSTIDALDARVALLDEKGTIIAVNQPWKSFAERNQYAGAAYQIGRNYLEVCGSGTECVEARMVSDGIRGLMSGELEDFRCVYPSAHADEACWFQVRVNRFYTDGVLRMVVAHEDVTEIKQAHDAQQHLTGLLLRAQDEERRRIARDLHDVTVQNMAAIKADLTLMQRGSHSLGPGAVATLEESVSLCNQVIKELRTLSYLLHPPFLDEAGLVPALHWFVRGFIQRSGIQVELLVMDDIGRLPTDIETALFRVVQESLTNIHRHSGSRSAVIWVTKELDTVHVRVTDEGHGFSPPATPDNREAGLPPGVGILGMRQRLRQLGGQLEIESSPEGTTVSARISISEDRYAAYSHSR